MKNAIEVKKLTKTYDNFKLNNINLDIPSGTVVGLIGENGAGKSTLIKAILNIIKIDRGSIKIFELDNKKDEKQIKKDVGVVLDNTFFSDFLNPNQINSIMKDVYDTWDSEYFFENLLKFKIPTNKIIKEMSKGMKKKVEIVTALAHKPKLLILDEPTSGLDPIVRSDVLDMFLDFVQDKEHTILFSSHITSDIEHTADSIVLIDNGNIILNDDRINIYKKYGIITCSHKEFDKLDKEDIYSYRRNRQDYQVLVTDKTKIMKKYPTYNIDKINLEDLMVLMIKGEKTK